jgi:Cytochrome c554 and c-prime
VGAQVCARCHDRAGPDPDAICRCTEMKTWKERDRHALAYLALVSDRGREMGKQLGRDVSRDAACLACHGVETSIEADRSYHAEQEGVTCVLCHGTYSNWIYEHGSDVVEQRERWRKLTSPQKERDYGMYDLWDPGQRALRCASCHVGGPGKFVTHEMYAAGHPPLPSFEVSQWSEQMPRHWQLMSEKPSAVRRLMGFDDQTARAELVELVSQGSVATLYQAVKLVEDQALRARQNDGSLDLAVFDCYACHHDLKLPASDQPSWRQERGYHGVPGRPPMRAWPWVLTRAAITNAAREAGHPEAITGVQADFVRLLDGFAARPFGEPAKIGEAAGALASRLDVMRQSMSRSWNDQRARGFAADICSAGLARRCADFDEARSIGWALTTLLQERPILFTEAESRLRVMNGELGLNIAGKAVLLDRLNDYNPVRFERELEILLKTPSPTVR